MKAISLWQPYASAIALGLKTYETRSWPTSYRGPLAIHAAKHKPVTSLMLAGFLADAGVKCDRDLPLGGIVAIAELVACVPTDGMNGYLSGRELAFGDYSPGRFAWRLEGIRPVGFAPCRGYQGFWNWEGPEK